MEIPPTALQPRYELSGEDSSVVLYDGPMDLVSETQGPCVPGNGVVRLVAWPYRGYVLRFEGPLEGPAAEVDDFVAAAFNGRTVAFQTSLRTRRFGSSAEKLIVEGWFIDEILLGNPCPVDAVIFHLLDFPKVADRSVQLDTGTTSWARGVGEGPTWGFVIDEVLRDIAPTESLMNSRVQLSHVGQLIRVDGKPIELAWLEKKLETLRRFLSLLLGKWTGPLLVVGEHQGQECWSVHRNFYVGNHSMGRALIPTVGHVSWESYSRALSRFEALREDDQWSELLKRAVTWYIEANTTTEAATTVVLSQAGLELMAWGRLALSGGLAEGFDKLRAVDAIRHTLVLSGIPVQMTEDFEQRVLEHLKSEQRKEFSKRRLDGPEWLTEVRNAVVHPKQKLDVSDPGILQLAGRLGLRYLELLLMNLLGYDGLVRNRTVPDWPDEPVPWSELQIWPAIT